jgi:hypothetical protein
MKNQITMLKESIERAENEKFIIYNCGGVQENKQIKQYVIINDDNQNAYNVTVEGSKVIKCDCPHHTYRNSVCKHMIKIAMEKNLEIV